MSDEIIWCDTIYKVGFGIDVLGNTIGYIIPEPILKDSIKKYSIGLVWKKGFLLQSDAEQSLAEEFNCDKIVYVTP